MYVLCVDGRCSCNALAASTPRRLDACNQSTARDARDAPHPIVPAPTASPLRLTPVDASSPSASRARDMQLDRMVDTWCFVLDFVFSADTNSACNVNLVNMQLPYIPLVSLHTYYVGTLHTNYVHRRAEPSQYLPCHMPCHEAHTRQYNVHT